MMSNKLNLNVIGGARVEVSQWGALVCRLDPSHLKMNPFEAVGRIGKRFATVIMMVVPAQCRFVCRRQHTFKTNGQIWLKISINKVRYFSIRWTLDGKLVLLFLFWCDVRSPRKVKSARDWFDHLDKGRGRTCNCYGQCLNNLKILHNCTKIDKWIIQWHSDSMEIFKRHLSVKMMIQMMVTSCLECRVGDRLDIVAHGSDTNWVVATRLQGFIFMIILLF